MTHARQMRRHILCFCNDEYRRAAALSKVPTRSDR